VDAVGLTAERIAQLEAESAVVPGIGKADQFFFNVNKGAIAVCWL
jgi:hypothetical protein